MKGITKMAMAFAVLAIVAAALVEAAQPIQADVANDTTTPASSEPSDTPTYGKCGGVSGCKATCGCGCGGNPEKCGCGQ